MVISIFVLNDVLYGNSNSKYDRLSIVILVIEKKKQTIEVINVRGCFFVVKCYWL